MRGEIVPNVIANTKETKIALIVPLVWIFVTLISTFYRVFVVEVPPLPGIPLVST